MTLKSRLLCAAMACIATAGSVAEAAPQVVFRARFGDVHIYHYHPVEWGGGNTAAIFNIKSDLDNLRAPTNSLPSPIILDTGDLPRSISLLNVPPGNYALFGAAQPGTHFSHISVTYYPAIEMAPQLLGIYAYEEAPEPASLVIATVAFTGLVVTARRCR